MTKQNILDGTSWSLTPPLHRDLLAAKESIYDKCNFKCSPPLAGEESVEYGAFHFDINNQSIQFRVAKITPTKTGQFVTLWKRFEEGPIQPFEVSDPIDLFVISVRKGNRLGQFIFPKSVLCAQGVVSFDGTEGKRAIRVYPPWDKTTSLQAQKTQKWQLDFFLEIPDDKPVDKVRAKILYS
jgi:hypothetical protein